MAELLSQGSIARRNAFLMTLVLLHQWLELAGSSIVILFFLFKEDL
jgi:hypothetical protein